MKRLNKKQFEPRYFGIRQKTYLNVLLALLFILIVIYVGSHLKNQQNLTRHFMDKSQAYAKEVKELSVTPALLSEHDQIEFYIKQVFGKDSPKAFKVLSCENFHLIPDAVNVNTDGSRDYGIFQINNHWQGVSNVAFLTDWKINVQMAYNIFRRNGDFHLWSCGKRFGI